MRGSVSICFCLDSHSLGFFSASSSPHARRGWNLIKFRCCAGFYDPARTMMMMTMQSSSSSIHGERIRTIKSSSAAHKRRTFVRSGRNAIKSAIKQVILANTGTLRARPHKMIWSLVEYLRHVLGLISFLYDAHPHHK